MRWSMRPWCPMVWSISLAAAFLGAEAGLLPEPTEATAPQGLAPPSAPSRLPAESQDIRLGTNSRQSSQGSGAAVASSSCVLNLTIEEAVRLALEHHRGLRVERWHPQIRRTYEAEARAVFHPVLETEASTGQERRQGVETNPGDSELATVHRARVGISTRLPLGTEVSFELEGMDRAWEDDSAGSTARAGLTVTQPLLRGLGLRVNLAPLSQASLNTRISECELRGFVERLVTDVETAYWNCVLAERQVEIAQQSLALAEQQEKETEARIAAGTLAETERAAARAEVALRWEAVIEARSRQETLRLQLLRFLNPSVPDGGTLQLALRTAPIPLDVALEEVDAHCRKARENRSDLQQAQLLVQRGELEVIQTRDGLLPRLEFFLTLGKTAYAESVGASLREMDRAEVDVVAGLRGAWPLGGQAAKARHQRAIGTREQAREAVENLAQLVEMEVRAGYAEVQRFAQQMAATQVTRRWQEEKLHGERQKFRVGRSTALAVAQAQRDLMESRHAEIAAVVNYLVALGELFRRDGSLLERRGITIGLPPR